VTVFVDTSALFALLDEDDANHARARATFARLRGRDLVTHSYVVVEVVALVSRRLGWTAVERLIDGILPVIRVEVVDAAAHVVAMRAFRSARSVGVSLVDQASFTMMRAERIRDAFAFDRDFAAEGFREA
jgi:predicted nucleic acid-binding protein